MAKLISLVALLLLVLPALIAAGGHKSAATKCKLSVTTKLSDSASRQYTATINNVGSVAAANVLVTPSGNVRNVAGLTHASNGGYSLASSAVSAGGVAAGSSYTFTYIASRNSNVRWSSSCTDAASSATSGPTEAASTTSAATSASATTKAQTNAPVSTTKATAPASSTKATTAPTGASATTKPNSSGSSVGTSAPSSGRVCPSGSWWAPSPQTTWQWQLTGTIDQTVNVQMYDIDLYDATPAIISALHSKGRVVVCYFSTQYENWRPDASSFTSAVRGNGLDGWAGEEYVDIRSTVVRNIMTARLDLAASKGCDGVEPDNVDGYQASTGFPLTAADQISFNSFIAAQGHTRGLSVGLKNDVDQATALQPFFDWALNEQCNQYSECGTLNNFITAGKAVFNCEYSGTASSLCPKMATAKFSTLIKSLDLTAAIKSQCCTYQSNGCADAPYRCITSL